MRDIKNEIDNLVEGHMGGFALLNFEEGTFINERNQSFPMYKLTKTGIQQLCMRYDAIIRAKVNMKLEEMSKPVCIEDWLIQSAQNMKELRLEQEQQQLLLTRAGNFEFIQVLFMFKEEIIVNELIKVNKENDKITVLGRDLHKFLESNEDYTSWFKRMCEYCFEENRDFVQVDISRESDFTGIDKRFVRPKYDHQLTLDMAKEISMIQRNEKGKQARQYFIECEKKLNTPVCIDYSISSKLHQQITVFIIII